MKQPRHTPISYIPIILLAAVLLALGLFALVRCNTPPVVVTVTPVVVTVAPTMAATGTPTATATNTQTPITPNTPTATPTPPPTTRPTATPATPQPTPDLLGTHRVRRGETMFGIALAWYPRRWFLWAEHAWRPICDQNPQIVDCRMIFVGDVLAIPRLR